MEPFEQTPTPVSSTSGSDTNVDGKRKSTFGDGAVWMRGLYMLLLAFAFGIGQALLSVTALVQFLWLLFSGEPNRQLMSFGGALSRWLSDVARYLTCNSDVRPFPWAGWPAAE